MIRASQFPDSNTFDKYVYEDKRSQVVLNSNLAQISNDNDFESLIKIAQQDAMDSNPNLLLFGLGVTDPKGIFGTTLGFQKRYGAKRVFDTPTSENALTGIGVGLALVGYPSIMVHQRLDFFLLAMDQLVNSAAKWHFMFGGQLSCNLTIRLIGRGWGQGPTHSQSLQSWFAHIPGLKVVMPSSAEDAYSLLIESCNDPNPVIFLEHRWLHKAKSSKDIRTNQYHRKIGESAIIKSGKDITIVSMGYLTVEARHAVDCLHEFDLNCELIDLGSIKPIDWKPLVKSLEKTGRLLVLETSHPFCSVGSEIVSTLSRKCFNYLRQAPSLISHQLSRITRRKTKQDLEIS